MLSTKSKQFSKATLCRSIHTSPTQSSLPFEGRASTKLWGARFSKETSPAVKDWVDSLPIDENLIEIDLWGSMAHVTMLGCQGIIAPEVAADILPTLKGFQDAHYAGKFDYYNAKFRMHDDVHMNNEARLIDTIGADHGGRMHTTRSRNDQVVLDSKLYARNRVLELRKKMIPIVEAFLKRAEGHLEDVMVGYTHVQHAQPISVAYWLTHYAAIFLRDLERLKFAYDHTDQNPLGGGALAGTSFNIDRELTTKLMGFQEVHPHGLDATSSRDFMLDILYSCASIQVTMSRLAEELIFWSSFEFQSITLDDGYAMGSSMMPQKKNPGSLELLRGRSGRIFGLLQAGMVLMKGLPSGYNRDFHEDKEILVECLDLMNKALPIIPALVESTTLNYARMEELTYGAFCTATEVANYLVAQHNVPFRQAHHIVGSLVGDLSRAGKNFKDLDTCLDHVIITHKIPADREKLKAVFNSKAVMLSYNSLGGTGPKAVQKMMNDFNKELARHNKVIQEDEQRLKDALKVTREIAAAASGIKSAQDLKNLIPQSYRSNNQ